MSRPRVLALVSNFKWSHIDYLVALGRHFDVLVAASGEVHQGSVANGRRWGLKIEEVGRLETAGEAAVTARLQQLLELHRPDLSHVLYYHHEALVPILRRLLGPSVPLVFECRDPLTSMNSPGCSGSRTLEAAALQAADAYIVVSQATREYYQQLHGRSLDPCLIVPHAFAARTMGGLAQPKLSQADGRLHLVLVGTARAEPDSGRYYGNIIRRLTAAGVVVHSHFHNIHGATESYAALAQELPDYHAHAPVPFREETILSDLMCRYDALGVFHELEAPAGNESRVLRMCLPTKAVCGWFHGGIPVVCYPHYLGVRESLESLDIGFVVEDLAEVGALARQPQRLQESGQRCRAQRENFSHEHHAERVQSFFDTLIRARCRR